MTDTLPHVRVIVPVYEDWDGMQACLAALDRQTYPREQFEVVVVDNGSKAIPPLPSYTFQWELRSCDQPGSYAARNLGLQLSEAELFAFTDSDCQPEARWLERGVDAFMKSTDRVDLLAGRIELHSSNGRGPTAAELLERAIAFRQGLSVKKKGTAATANLFVRRAVIEATGGFDERAKSGGDTDLCKRARSLGFQIAYAPDATVRHPTRSTIEEVAAKARRKIGGKIDRCEGLRSKLMLGGRVCMPPVPTIHRICTAAELSKMERLRALGALLLVRSATAWEWFRVVALGRATCR